MQKITTCLWFDNEAEEAANFYVSIFRNSRIGDISRYSEAVEKVSGKKAGSVLVVMFEIDGQEFLALNGGPQFKFSEAISIVVNCDSQAEVDELWAKLTAGGKESQCGWLTDKFGLSWQIVPKAFTEMMRGKDAKKVNTVMTAMLQMKKLDIAKLQQAFDAA